MNAQTEAWRKWLALLCACVVWTPGCFMRRAPARPIINGMGFRHPVIPPATTDAELEPPPEIPFDAPPVPPRLVTSHSMPARPRVAPPPGPEAAPVGIPEEPTIAPGLTTEELKAAKAETQQNLDMVEKNLTLAWGRTLNATQQDLASKVRGFVENAREAMRSGDWERAKNLSKKAKVLSEQLATGL